jgi:Response regulator with putative antiterminator output domain
MAASSRETMIVETFVGLADVLVVGYDVVELLHQLVERCAVLLDATDAGIMLADPSGSLEVVASTSERTRLIGLMQLNAKEGPCVEASQTGEVVSVGEIAEAAARWPRFCAEAAELGYTSVHAVPLRLRNEVLGSLNLFRDAPGALSTDDARVARALADVATIGILQERALRESDIARQQLQRALDSRVLIEQAKGVLAYSDGIDMDEAFRRLRATARNSGRKLAEVAVEVAVEVIDGAQHAR